MNNQPSSSLVARFAKIAVNLEVFWNCQMSFGEVIFNGFALHFVF